MLGNSTIEKTKEIHNCIVCNSGGEFHFAGLKDRLYNVPGSWNYKKCSNAKCGLLWMDPMPDEDELWKTYVDYYTHGDSIEPSLIKKIFKPIEKGYLFYKYDYNINMSLIDKLISPLVYLFPTEKELIDFDILYLKNQANKKLLDIGCGNGDFILKMKNLGWETHGIDFDSKAIKYCQERNLDASHGDLTNHHFEDGLFDVITINNVIEHLRYPEKIIPEIYRILNSKGKLIIVTPNTESFLFQKVYQSSWYHLEPSRHLFLFNAKNLARLLEKNKFNISKSFSNARNDFWVDLASRNIRKKGKFQHEDKSFFAIVKGKLVQLYIMLRSIKNRHIGGELIMVAKKNGKDAS